MDNKTKNTIYILISLFIFGFILILFSYPIGEILSRQYEGSGCYSTNYDEVVMKTISFNICGAVLSLVSGFGSIAVIIKKYLN